MTRSIAFIATCVVTMSTANVFAAIITLPTSLKPGDKYRLAFVTSGIRNAASSNIADYNTFVTNSANSVPALAILGTSWKVIGSTETVDARDNTNTVPSTVTGGSLGVPIFLLNDTKLVESNDDLWDGSIIFALDRTELDTVTPSPLVFTGTGRNGTAFLSTFFASTFVRSGETFFIGSRWVEGAFVNSPLSLYPFYAISGELLVIPEPCTFTLLLTALMVVGVMYRGRKQYAAHRC